MTAWGTRPEMHLPGEKSGRTVGLDGKTVIKDKPDPKVLDAARKYVAALEDAEDSRERAGEFHIVLQLAFKATKLSRHVKVVTDRRTYRMEFRVDEKIIIKKDRMVEL